MIIIQGRFTKCSLLQTCGLLLAVGCAEESSILPDLPRIEAPESFQADGLNWQREEGFSGSDTAVLSRFFQLQPGMQGSPAVAGVPVIYHGVQNRRRFYWVQGTADGPLWSCVEFSQGRYQFLEGTGNPYQTDAP